MNGFNEFLTVLGLGLGAVSVTLCWCGKQFYDAVCGVELDEAGKTRLYEGYTIIGTQIIVFSAVMGALSVAAFATLALAACTNEAHGLETSMASEIAKFAAYNAAFFALSTWLFKGPLSKLAWNRRYRPDSYVDNKTELKVIRFMAGCLGFGCAVALQAVFVIIG